MKKFLLYVGIIVIGFFSIVAISRGLWYGVFPELLERNTIKSDVHTIVIGASNGERTWDDSVIPYSRNLSSAARSYLSNLTALRYAMEYNDKCSIDTVILCANFPSFLYYTDEVLNQPNRLINDEITSILSQSEFFHCHKNSTEYIKLLLLKSPVLNFKRSPIGQYAALEECKLADPRVYNQLNQQLLEVGGKYGLTESFIRNKCTIQVSGIRYIKDYCDSHGLVLIIFHSPLYKVTEMVSDKGYKDYLLSEFGDSLLIADYTHFEFPDTTYYYDLEHVRKCGAKMLSEHIRDNGLDLQYSIDYCAK